MPSDCSRAPSASPRTASTCSARGRPTLGPRRSTGRATSRPARRWPLDHISRVHDRLPRRLRHQGAVGALALPAPAAARRGASADRRAALARRDRRAARRLDRRQPRRVRRQLGVHDGRRDPRRELGRDARAASPSGRRRALVRPVAREPAAARALHPLAPRVGARCAATTTSPTSSGCCSSRRCSRRAARGARGRAGRRAELAARDAPPGARPTAATTRRRSRTTGSSRELFVCGAQAAEALVPGALSPAFARAARARCSTSSPTTRGPTASRRRSATPTTGASCRSATTAAPIRATTATCSRQAGRGYAPAPRPRGVSRRRLLGHARRRAVRARPLRRRRPRRRRRATPTTTRSRSSSRSATSRSSSTPAAYLYTADPAERNRFRSTAFHSTLQIDGAEQNPLLGLAVRDGGPAPRGGADVGGTEGRAVFSGRHRRLSSPSPHRRRKHAPSSLRRQPADLTIARHRRFSRGNTKFNLDVPARTLSSGNDGCGCVVASFSIRHRARDRGRRTRSSASNDGWFSPCRTAVGSTRRLSARGGAPTLSADGDDPLKLADRAMRTRDTESLALR